MKESKLDIVLHPIRMGIIQNFTGGRKLTVQQIGELMPDVPQATLYRHLNKLVKSDILTVVEENQVRGTVEKVYSIAANALKAANEEGEKATKEENLKYFFTYLMDFMGDFEKYLNKEDIDMEKDGLSYRRGKFYMTDEEFIEFIKDIRSAYEKIIHNEPSENRKGRTMGLIMIPDGDRPKK